MVDDALAIHAPADSRAPQQLGGARLEHPGADPRLDVLAAAVLEHDRVDAFEVEQVRERQPGRPGADDPDLRAHQPPSGESSSVRCATAKAAFAAGTPQ